MTDVSLNEPVCIIDENTVLTQSNNLRLKLPRVRRLSIRGFHTFFMDFVLPIQALEHLQIYIHVRWNQGHNDCSSVKNIQTIKLIGYRETMNSSYIWNLFSKLKTIELVCDAPNVRDKIYLYAKEL